MSNAINSLYNAYATSTTESQPSAPPRPQAAPLSQEKLDTISLTLGAPLDEEAQELMDNVQQDLAHNREEALSAHQGLDYSRVMALLDGL